MTLCPWCKAQNPSGSAGLCARCGKRAADHPSIAGAFGGRSVDDLDEDEGDARPVPSLDLDFDLGRPASARPVGGHGGHPSTTPIGRTVDEDDWDDGAPKAPVPSLELDLSGPLHSSPAGSGPARTSPPPSHRVPSLAARDLEPARTISSARAISSPRAISVPASAPSQSAAPMARRPAHDRAVATAGADFEPYEIEAVAGFGKPPDGLLASVPYAIRVVRRRRELRVALEAARRALAEAESRRDDRLAELAAAERSRLVGDRAYADLLEIVAAAEGRASSRTAAAAEASATFGTRVAGIDAAIAALDPPLVAARVALEQALRASEEAEDLRRKHEARRKRVEIEVRAAQTKLGNPATAGDARAAAEALVAAADQERATRRAEEKLAEDAAAAARTNEERARSALAALEEQLEARRGDRRALEQEFARQGAAQSAEIASASREVRAALAALGARLLERGPIDESRRRAPDDAGRAAERLRRDVDKHVRALSSGDAQAVRRGLVLLGTSVALVVIAFVAWRLLRTNPYLPPELRSSSAASLEHEWG